MTTKGSRIMNTVRRRFGDPFLTDDLSISPLSLSQHEITDTRKIGCAQGQAATHMWKPIGTSLEPVVCVDPDRLEQILPGELISGKVSGAVDDAAERDYTA